MNWIIKLDAVIDTNGNTWVHSNKNFMYRIIDGHSIRCKDIRQGVEILKTRGHIKQDPLEKALEAYGELMDVGGNLRYPTQESRTRNIIRTMHSELTDE